MHYTKCAKRNTARCVVFAAKQAALQLAVAQANAKPCAPVNTGVMYYVVNHKFAHAMRIGTVNNRLNARTYYGVYASEEAALAHIASVKGMRLYACIVAQ